VVNARVGLSGEAVEKVPHNAASDNDADPYADFMREQKAKSQRAGERRMRLEPLPADIRQQPRADVRERERAPSLSEKHPHHDELSVRNRTDRHGRHDAHDAHDAHGGEESV
jgi:hypothetical protein